VKSGCADIYALLLGGRCSGNNTRRITRTRCGNGRIVRMRERVSQRDARRGSFDRLEPGSGHRMAHDRTPFYTETPIAALMPHLRQGTRVPRRSILKGTKVPFTRLKATATLPSTIESRLWLNPGIERGVPFRHKT